MTKTHPYTAGGDRQLQCTFALKEKQIGEMGKKGAENGFHLSTDSHT